MKPGPDKLVLDILKGGIQVLRTNDEAWDILLDQWPAEDVARLRAGFRAQPPAPKLSWARTSDRWPVWSVALADESPTQEFLNNSGGRYIRKSGDDTAVLRRYSVVQQAAVSIWVLSENADVTREHSILVKALLLGAVRDVLPTYEGFYLRSLADLQPNPQWLPEHLFVREQVWAFIGYDATAVAFPAGYLLHPPVFLGVEGHDLGDGVTGKVEPRG